MKLKKGVKKKIIIAVVILLVVIIGIVLLNLPKKTKEKEEVVKVVNEVEKYGYELKETKSKRYKKCLKN